MRCCVSRYPFCMVRNLVQVLVHQSLNCSVVMVICGGSVSMRFTDDYSFVGPGRVEGICWDILLFVCCFDVCFYFEFVHLLVICVFVHYGVQELVLVWVRFICEFNGVVYVVD